MNMQIYHQIAVINTKVKTVRNLLAEVETQQATLEQLLHYRQGKNRLPAGIAPVVQEKPGDDYVESLIHTGMTA